MLPVKPYPTATFHVGKYDDDLVAFAPSTSVHRRVLTGKACLECENHVIDGGPRYISPGEPIVAVRWVTGGSGGKATYAMRYYCCLTCQRNDALELRTKHV